MKKQKFPINLFLPYLGFYSAQAIFGTYLNLYLNDVGFSKTQMGMFTSLSTLLVLIVQPLWGYVSDRSKTKNRIYLTTKPGAIQQRTAPGLKFI